MREIKFRAWHPTGNHGKGCMLFVGDDWGTTDPLDCCNYLRQGQQIELEQYTGLEDANGVEIYEGDILECIDPEDNSRFSVVYRAPSFMKNYGLCGTICPMDPSFTAKWFAIVGNIHQNPELLETPK